METTTRTAADAPYVYDGTQLTAGDRRVTALSCDIKADGKTPAELFALAQSQHQAYERFCQDGRHFEADRASLEASMFDRIARDLLSGNRA
jgi:hypothetical protein